MKQKVTAWTAAVLIVALVSVAFLVPANPNPDFGYVNEVYSPYDEIPITDCEGDTHLLKAEAVTFRHLASCPTIRFAVAEGHGIVFEHASGSGVIEKLVDSEWIHYDELHIEPPTMMTTIPPYDIIDGDEDFVINLQIAEAGEYRFIYYFRELLDSGTAGEELYSISHTYTIPEPSGKPFDLLSLSINDYVFSSGLKRIYFVIRENGYEKLPDTVYGRLEVLRDGEWIDAPPKDGYETALSWSSSDEGYRLYNRDGIRYANMIVVYANDLTADYRLTLEFVENEDGSGERYTLQFCMNFSEEG